MTYISTTELVKLLREHKGAAPITISALTNTGARKTGNPYSAIYKLSTINGFTGHDYENSVNRQLVREGQSPGFEAQERKWGTNINNLIVEYKGKFYLRLRPLNSSSPIYFGQLGNQLKRVEKSAIEKFLPSYRAATNQNTEKEIVHRDFLVENIRSVTFNGNHYEVIHS